MDFETQQRYDELRTLFQKKVTLKPKTIRLRNISQEKHILRMKKAYQKKQIGNQNGCCFIYPSSKQSPRSNNFEPTAKLTQSVDRGYTTSESLISEGDFKHSGTFDSDESCSTSRTYDCGDAHRHMTRMEDSEERNSGTNVDPQNDDERIYDEAGFQGKKVLKKTTESFSSDCLKEAPAPEKTKVKTEDVQDDHVHENILNTSHESVLQVFKSTFSSPELRSGCKPHDLPRYGLDNNGVGLDPLHNSQTVYEASQTQTPATNHAVNRPSRIPVSIHRLVSRFISETSERNISNDNMEANHNANSGYFVGRGPSKKKSFSNGNTSGHNSISYASDTRQDYKSADMPDSPTRSKSGFLPDCNTGVSPDNDSSIASWTDKLEFNDENYNGRTKISTAQGSNLKTSTFSKKRFKLTLNVKQPPKHCDYSVETETRKYEKADSQSQVSSDCVYQSGVSDGNTIANDNVTTNYENKISKKGDRCNGSGNNNSQYLTDQNCNTRKPEKQTEPEGDLDLSSKPQHYSTPYNLRFPRHRWNDSKSIVEGTDDKSFDNCSIRCKTPKSKTKSSNKTPKHKTAAKYKKSQKQKKPTSKKK